MNTKTSLLLCAALTVVIILSPVSAFAQEPSMGLVMGTSSVSFIWQLSDRAAIRPEVGFSTQHSSGGTTTNPTHGESWQATPGFSALFYLKKVEGLRTYFSPRYSYLRVRSTSTSGVFGTSTSTGTQHSVAGSFGAQYSLHRHFGVFGELGVGYTRTNTSTWTLGNRAALGAILFF
jgi:hypothetical protein